MNISLTWITGGGFATQDVQYKLSISSSWITHENVAGNVTTSTINGLLDNRIYDFRIVTNCVQGTSSSSVPIQQINITCPSLSTIPSDVSIDYSFPELGGSITGYTVKLFDSAGTTELASQIPVGTTTRSGTFTGLTEVTVYKIRVIITAGSFSKTNCAMVNVTTLA